MSIEIDLDRALHGIDLSSRSSTKFDEARLLLSTGEDPRSTMKLMSKELTWERLLKTREASRGIRIVKDLSELAPDAAARHFNGEGQ